MTREISDSEAAVFADELRSAERYCVGHQFFTDQIPGFGWDDARAIALARDGLRIADGEEHVGYKLGWTSAAMREALGIERPNWGTLWESQRLVNECRLGDYLHPKLEPELVYLAAEDLEGDVTPEDVLDAMAGWSVGIELVDPRFRSFDFEWLDNTADNSSAAGFSVGQLQAPNLELPQTAVTFSDGTDERSGHGGEAMGSPLEAVAWLVKALSIEGAKLSAGHLVLTGGLTAPFDAASGTRYSATAGRSETSVVFS